MNITNEIIEAIKKELGVDVDIKVIEVTPIKDDDKRTELDSCFDYLDAISDSENFGNDLVSVLSTIEKAIHDIKKHGDEPLEKYIKDINNMINSIIVNGSYTIEIKVK